MKKNDINQKIIQNNLDAFLVTKGENLRFVTNFSGGEGFCIINKNGDTHLIVDSRYTCQANEEANSCKVIEYKSKELLTLIADLLKDSSKVGIEDSISVGMLNKFKSKNQNREFVPTNNFFEELRIIKSEDEIELIRKAEVIAEKSFIQTLSSIKSCTCENDLAAILEFEMKKNGAQKVSFETIVACSERSAMPHGVASCKKLCLNDVITFDFGCFFKGYASDCTRTISFGKPDNNKVYDIYKIVLEAQFAAIDMIKEGIVAKDVDLTARNIIKNAGYGDNFGHGLGHGVGLEIHELPRVNFESETILKEGMVITIEPGIYLNNQFGVRIEDMVVVRKNGCENLTKLEKNKLIEL